MTYVRATRTNRYDTASAMQTVAMATKQNETKKWRDKKTKKSKNISYVNVLSMDIIGTLFIIDILEVQNKTNTHSGDSFAKQ